MGLMLEGRKPMESEDKKADWDRIDTKCMIHFMVFYQFYHEMYEILSSKRDVPCLPGASK